MAKPKNSISTVKSANGAPATPHWLLLSYEPVSLFSLRSTYSMSKGGKTLLLPTPYSVKMAFIDAMFRQASPESPESLARDMFDRIKERRIRFRPPRECIVQNTFVKIRQDERGAASGRYVPTIAYREFVFFSGILDVALDIAGWSDDDSAIAISAAAHINYFGKRGSFFQFRGSSVVDELPSGFTVADGDQLTAIAVGVYGVTQFLDDFGPELCMAKDGFERISTYHDKDIKIGKHRVLVSTLVPYRRIEASRSFTWYTSRPAQDT